MSTTTVRVGRQTKETLERLQQEWRRTQGRAPTQQELLQRGLQYLEDHKEDFLKAAAWKPLTEDELRELRRRQARYGPTNAAEIDGTVYGESA